ncbi:MAG: nucleotidyl transferase AbiEii/AbiGii toxin family protein [Candidatus Harrisonbacteria bacterium]|nr:nucleotidyl transferase AbiEii/AbiGii toxin family protein [Candidatus Harrisonbacteria bacterium]
MHTQILPGATKRVLQEIGEQPWIKNFYLAGGTALAIQYGHRESIDLDFFSTEDFDIGALRQNLARLGELRVEAEESGTLHGVLEGVRISFLRYQYPLLFPLIIFEGVQVADERDIAAMKLDAISARGSKKDFIDLYFLLEKYSFKELLNIFQEKYRTIEFNKLHMLKSLTYFDDADREGQPIMSQSISWEKIKVALRQKTEKLLAAD